MNSNKLPNGWKIEKLENLAIVSSGQGAPQNKSDYGDEGYPFVKASHLELLCNGGNEETIPKINNEVASDKKLKLYDKGTIIFAKSGMSCMKERVCAINEPCYIVNHLACIMPKAINSKYLMYFLKKNPPTRLIKDMSYPSIRLSDIAEMKIIVPPEKIQNNIVDILEKSKGVLEKRKEAIDLLDELVKSKFIEMFGDPVTNPKGWEKKKLNELGELSRGKSKHRPRNAPELLGGPYPLVQTGDIANAGIYLKEYTQTYSELGLKQSKMWDKGTLCITIAANIAKTSILTFDACFPDSVVAFIPNDKTNNMFIQFWMFFLQKILEDSAPESAQKNINLKILSEQNVIVPPIELQNQFADFVNQVDKLKFEMEESLKELENNFNSLMQRAFKGKLFN